MSIIVKHAALHQLVQQPLNNEESKHISFKTNLRETLLPLSTNVEQLMLTLHQVYQSRSINYGIFRESSPFANQLNKWLSKEESFLTFSCNNATLLAKVLAEYSFAHSGTIFMCHYNYLATDYLFIAILNSRSSMLVDDELNIQLTQYLDMAQFEIACRINLTDLQNHAHSKRYLTFLKGRIGYKVSEFFMCYLDAAEGLNPKAQNQSLLQAIQDYCETNNLSNAQVVEVKNQAFEYCQTQLKNNEDIQITELSAQLPTLNQHSFDNFTQNNEKYDLEESFPPVRNSLKKLTKYSGYGKGINISFDANLLHNRVEWDKENDRLIINELPPNLRNQLERIKH